MAKKINSRRVFLKRNALTMLGIGISPSLIASSLPVNNNNTNAEPIIDIHQHVNFHDRSNAQLVAHQRAMGVTTTILLPAGRSANTPSTHGGSSNGLQAEAGTNEACYKLAREHPGEFLFGANEVPDLPDAIQVIEKYLKLGAKVIGESKFGVESDSPEMQKIYELAQEYDVPVLMHWQHNKYNYGLDRFHKMLEKYPRVNFLGHAQAWWANIDKNHQEEVVYPKSKVTAGGLTDRLLRDYPNMYGDLSAGSGLNALLRDEEHTQEFLDRHQDKLLFGSDCADPSPRFPQCQGANTIEAIKRLSPNKEVERKLLFENAQKLFRL
jgi:predicted TIM-barrel fold metal-dependent hydrolase